MSQMVRANKFYLIFRFIFVVKANYRTSVVLILNNYCYQMRWNVAHVISIHWNHQTEILIATGANYISNKY